MLPNAKHILLPSKRLKFRGQDNVHNSDVMMPLFGEIPDSLKSHLTYTVPCSGIVLP